jgi:hypothetical protein
LLITDRHFWRSVTSQILTSFPSFPKSLDIVFSDQILYHRISQYINIPSRAVINNIGVEIQAAIIN